MIPLIWGTRLYGAVDRIHGVFYVATRFGHLWYIPLIPTQSFLIFHGTESSNGFKGVPIPLSAMSVLMGWLRAACVIGGPIAFLVGGVGLLDGRASPDHVLTMLGGLGAIALFFLSYVLTKGDHARARVLAAMAKLPENLVDALLAGNGAAIFNAPPQRPAPAPAPRPRAAAPPRPARQVAQPKPVAPPPEVEAIDYDPASGL